MICDVASYRAIHSHFRSTFNGFRVGLYSGPSIADLVAQICISSPPVLSISIRHTDAFSILRVTDLHRA